MRWFGGSRTARRGASLAIGGLVPFFTLRPPGSPICAQGSNVGLSVPSAACWIPTEVYTMHAIFRPGERLMERLSLAAKFALLAAILLAPLAYVTWSFRNAKEYNVRIAVKEKHGDRYMQPAIALFAGEVEARAAAVR